MCCLGSASGRLKGVKKTMSDNHSQANHAKVDDRRPRLDEQKKQEMLAVAVRNPDAFTNLQEMLTVKYVRKWSEPMAVVWREVRAFYTQYGELPDRGQLHADLSNFVSHNQDALTAEELDVVDEFLEYAWDDAMHGPNMPRSAKHVKAVLRTCSQFLEEIISADFHRGMAADHGIAIDLPRLFETAQASLTQVRSLVTTDVEVPFPTGWDQRDQQALFSTGVPALDKFMGGGYRGGEVVLFMGPYGSCKTVLTCDGVANQLKYCVSLIAGGKAKRNTADQPLIPQVVLLFTESDKNEYRCRLMANIAMIPWERLASMRSVADLDDSAGPGATADTKYELQAFRDTIANGHPWVNEQTRIRNAELLANAHLLLLDCTATSDTVKVGAGGMEDIANVVHGVYRKRQATHYPVAFWLDHVSGLIDQVSTVVSDEAVLRRILMNVPRVATDRLCKPFNAPMVMTHQLAGDSQDKGPTGKLHHSNAEGSKAIAKYAPFAVITGPTDDGGMCKWDCTKHRRTSPSPYKIVYVNGTFNKLVDRSETHGIAPGQRVIMPKAEMAMLGIGAGTATGPVKFSDLTGADV